MSSVNNGHLNALSLHIKKLLLNIMSTNSSWTWKIIAICNNINEGFRAPMSPLNTIK